MGYLFGEDGKEPDDEVEPPPEDPGFTLVEGRRSKNRKKKEKTRYHSGNCHQQCCLSATDRCEGMINAINGQLNEIEGKRRAMGKMIATYMGVDSGAADTVCPKAFAPGSPTRETTESKQERYYLAANNTKIPIHGRKTVKGVTHVWNEFSFEAEVAVVKRPFASACKIWGSANCSALIGHRKKAAPRWGRT